jgi:hypothetical protein
MKDLISRRLSARRAKRRLMVLGFAVLNYRNGLVLAWEPYGNANGSGSDRSYVPVRGASVTKRELRCPVR